MAKSHYFILLAILLIGVFLRCYKLGSIPNGLYQDETAIGYNAYSINMTGRDEYGKSYPLYFKSFGDYKLPVYIYLTALSERMFGLTPFAVRFPSAFFGSVTILAFYFLIRALTQNKTTALIGAAFLAINPWHLHYSRATFEVTIGLFFFTFGSVLLAYAYEKRRGFFLAGTLCFIIALYTYNLTRLLAPILFVAVNLFLSRKRQLPGVRELTITVIISIVLLIPFALTFFSAEGISSSAGTLIFTSAAVQAPLQELRSYLTVLPPLVGKIFFNSITLTAWQYIINIYSYASVDFFFLHGSSHGNHGIGNTGLFYLLDFPLMIIGLYTYMKARTKTLSLVATWFVAVIAVSALTRESPHATRSFFLLFPLIVLTSQGTHTLFLFLKNIQTPLYRTAFFMMVFLAFGMNILYYLMSYYLRFPIAYAKSWRAADASVSRYIDENEKHYERIIIDRASGFIYSSLLFYTAFPPDEFQQTVKRLPDDSEGFSEVSSFSKYEIKDISEADFRKAKTLIITTPEKKPAFALPLSTFYYPKRPVVIALKQQIMRFPIEDIAYVAVAGVAQ